MSDNQSSSRVYGIIVTLLLLLSAGIGWFFWNKSKTILVEKEQQKVLLDSLGGVKMGLERQIDSLQLAYTDLRTENETLQGKIASTAAQVAQKESLVQQIKTQSTRDVNSLRGQVESLQAAKTEMETIINLLRAENSQLKNENVALKGENAALKGSKDSLAAEVNSLSDKLADQIRRTQSATFKATSFRVEIEKKNNKLTTRARRVREINVTFDLVDVPDQYLGEQKLYLVITDEKGKPIASTNPTKVTVKAPSGSVEITACAYKSSFLKKTNRESFAYKLEEKIQKGNYVVAIYCEHGLLGVASFRAS